MIEPELLAILRCPDTRQPLRLADDSVVAALNGRIEKGELSNRGGQAVRETMEGGLIRQDGVYLYPIRRKIPIMLIDEAIPLSPS